MSTIASIALFLRGYLPSAQIKVLDELFLETYSIFEKAIEDGLLPDETFRIAVRHKLAELVSSHCDIFVLMLTIS